MGEPTATGTTQVASSDRTRRRWLGRHRVRPGAGASARAVNSDRAPVGTGALEGRLQLDGREHATVQVVGLLVRQHAHLIDDVLADAFAAHRAWIVIDLRGVIQLDPTSLSAITRRADEARRRGALVTIVPPGTSARSAA